MIIKELMKPACIVEKDITLNEAARLMSQKGIGSIVVLSKGKIKGIITEKDIVKNFGKNKKISNIMSSPVITIDSEEKIDDALELMRDNTIKRLPVIDKSGVLVGIVTLTDIAANAEELEEDFFFE